MNIIKINIWKKKSEFGLKEIDPGQESNDGSKENNQRFESALIRIFLFWYSLFTGKFSYDWNLHILKISRPWYLSPTC